ncbi:hypothetical protein R1sor_000821 [Riccia sorocarpa]|uniref:Response regulatory domain-containing protein n=1 Tax=Riccia sorocarpa TaxID=122646 RepID=A0ABD3GWR9_9MARC
MAETCQKTTEGTSVADRSIILVDSDDSYLRMLERMLVECGYRVSMCGKVGQALEQLREKTSSGYDLILSSANMPGIDNLQFVYITRFKLKVPVVFMSFDEEPDFTVKGLIARGSCGYLQKPINIDTLQNLWSDDYLWSWRFKNRAFLREGKICSPAPADKSESPEKEVNESAGVSDEKAKPENQKADSVKDSGEVRIPESRGEGNSRKYFVWTPDLCKKFDDALNEVGGLAKGRRKEVFEKLKGYHERMTYDGTKETTSDVSINTQLLHKTSRK